MRRDILAATLLCLTIPSAPGQEFDLSWHSIDGGGVMRSIGGDLELSGTIGQPDAGVLAGVDFELNGGFWFQIAPSDCNQDGGVNLLDHSSFTDCLSGPGGGVLSGCECFDIDRSGAVDLRDFAAVQVVFSGS